MPAYNEHPAVAVRPTSRRFASTAGEDRSATRRHQNDVGRLDAALDLCAALQPSEWPIEFDLSAPLSP
jgi:hypothetical protein